MHKYPIVILPGWLLGSRRFQLLKEKFELLGFKAFILDFPGFEDSPPLTEVLNLNSYVRHLHKFLRLHQIDKTILVCHSFGGRVALKFASQEPKKVVALILSGTPGYPEVTQLRMLITVILSKIGKIVSFLPPFIFVRRKLKSIFYRLTKSTDYGATNGLLRESFKKIVKEQLITYMDKIRVPTLLVWGEADKLVPLKIAQKMQKTIHNAQLLVVSGKGHMFTYREPEIIVEKTIEFLKTLTN